VDEERLARTLAAIDAANANDPNTIVVRGEVRPKEIAHAALASEWIERLVGAPSEELRIATRAHHVHRWVIPRADYPAGRAGYLRWRRDLQRHHAEVAARILAQHGYDEATTARVVDLIRKRGPRRDPQAQAFEDALCLVFLETQLSDTAARLADATRVLDVLRKTLRKMSPRAIALARDLPLDAQEAAWLEAALID